MLVAAISQQEDEETIIPPYEGNLFLQLKDLRNQLAREENVPAYIIFSDATLQELATYLPGAMEDLKQISGFGEVKIQRYGTLFLEKVVAYRQEYELESRMTEKKTKRIRKPKKEKTTDTKLESLQLFQQGKSVGEIAHLRQLTATTIETHLAHFVLEGTLKVQQLVSDEKISWIAGAVQKHGDAALSPIKNELGESVSYGEIRMVVSHLRRKKTMKGSS